MKNPLLVLALCSTGWFFGGCTNAATARAQARAAFLAGQQEATARMMRVQSAASGITIIGPVRNPGIAWSEDLTVARAIVAAGYVPLSEPKQIVVIRNGEAVTIDPKRLLAGEDMPLEKGDVIQVQ